MIVETHLVRDHQGQVIMQQHVPKYREHERVLVTWPAIVENGVHRLGWTVEVHEIVTTTDELFPDGLTPPNWAEVATGLYGALVAVMDAVVVPEREEDEDPEVVAFWAIWDTSTEARGLFEASRLGGSLVEHEHDFDPDPQPTSCCHVCGLPYADLPEEPENPPEEPTLVPEAP